MTIKPNLSLLQGCLLAFGIGLTSIAPFSYASADANALASDAVHSEQQNSVDYKHVFDLEYAASPVFHPNKDMFIYERRSMDIMQDRTKIHLWTFDLSSKQHLPLLADEHSYRSPSFSPDGTRLAYLSSKSGSTQIYVHWLEQDRSAKITNLQKSPANITWSPDGKSIAFTLFTPSKSASLFSEMPPKPEGAKWAGTAKYIDTTQYRSDGAGFNQSGNTQVYIMPADGGTPRQLTHGAFNHGGSLSFSKDGKSLFVSANRNQDWELLPLESDIFKISIANGNIEKATSVAGPESSPMVSPNGKFLAYQWVNDRKLSYQVNQIMVQGIDGSDVSSLTPSLDRQIGAMTWAKDSKGIYFSYLDYGKTKLAYVSMKGKMNKLPAELGSQALGRPYTSGQFAISSDNDVVYTINNPQRPADLALMKKRGKPELLTQLNEDVFANLTLAQVEKLPVTSSVDQRDIDAWIAYPPHFDKSKDYPIILEIHGGPHAAYASTFSMELQLMAAKGYITVWSNPRGSSSYGEDFGNLIHHNYPSQDYNDLMDVVDAAIAKGNVDSNNLFITGGSGGGVLTAWSIGKTDRFAAAVVAKPVINWLSFALTADAYPFFTQYWMEDMPWNISDKLWKRSPLSLVGNVKTPTMLLTGEVDYRTPMSETEQYYQALRLQKIPSAMVRIPGASHGIASRPSHLIQKVGNIVAWFDKYKTE